MEMATGRVVAWICLVFADILAVMSLKEAGFSGDVKAGLSTFFGGFIIIPLTIMALTMFGKHHCFPVGWFLGILLLPIILVIVDIIKKL